VKKSRSEKIKERQNNRESKLCTPAPNICGSSVWNLLHVSLLAPETLKMLLDFLNKICAPLIQTVAILSDKYHISLPAAIPPYTRAVGYNKLPDLVKSTSYSPWNFHQFPRILHMFPLPTTPFLQAP
jgi:hypothetical protein